ncbi:MAG: deoxyribonuclease V [bacterium]|nr:deoxyribonuclease V [bacterium]
MRIPRSPHRWTLTPRKAIAVQIGLASRVEQRRPERPIRLVAGTDLAFSRDGRDCLAAVVVWDMRTQAVVEQHVARRKLAFPYVPGLLSFREAPALLAALRKLKQVPDVVMCDGHGLAHPRRFGIACHLGVILGLPTIGCAKSRLVGRHDDPAPERGQRTPLHDRGQRIGTVLRTRHEVKPVFVSVGHQIDLRSAERIVLACAMRYRLPEPTRLADRLAAEAKRKGT